MARDPEDARALAFVAFGAGALLFRYIRWWEAIALLAVAVAFAAYAAPRLRSSGSRVTDAFAEFHTARVTYPLALLVLVMLLPDRLDIVAGTWGILAAGDAVAALVGRRAAGRRIPWNPRKSVAGTAAGLVCGAGAAVFLCWWCRPAVVPPPYPWFPFAAGIAAAIVAGGAETLPIRLQDNLTVAAAAAATMWAVALVSEDLAREAIVIAMSAAPLAAAVNAAAAAGGWWAGAVSRSGAITGAVVGTLVAICAGWGGWVLLVVMYAFVVLASRAGSRRKCVLGIGEPNEGRRGAASVMANTGIALIAAVLATVTYAPTPALIAFVAAVVAGGADSIASEAGKAWARRTFVLPRFNEVPAGTPGAISMPGSAAGMGSSLALAALAGWLQVIPFSAVAPVVIGATAASLAESVLGTSLEPAGIVNSHVLNVITTAVAVAVALKLAA
jgi:uncharacterized protein (TIGR00297 family)